MIDTSASAGDRPKSLVNSAAFSLLILLLPVLVIALALAGLQPPSPAPLNAPAEDFSAERAMQHVRKIAQAPHPLGSNDGIRQYLVQQLEELGTNPRVSDSLGISHYGSWLVAGAVHNVLARLPGSGGATPILLVAHYDSVATGPGAADDGAAVAAILETVRALRAGPPLKNDVMVLFTDGEEEGLLGAEAIAAQPNPVMQPPGVVLNFEARGDHGPSLLFETSTNNAQLMHEVAQGASHPIASSLFYSLYKLLPNNTDFTIFRKGPSPGLNFAFGSGFEAYHSAFDTPENLSLASLQHHGSYALSLSRHFGQIDLSNMQRSGDAVFFDWYGDRLVVYGERWVIAGEVLLTLLLAITLALAIRRSHLTAGKLATAVLALLATLILVTVVSAALWWVTALLFSARLVISDSSTNSLLLAGFVLTSAFLAAWVLLRLQRKWSLYTLWCAGLVLLCVLSWPLAVILPAGSYLLFWPLVIVTAGALILELIHATPTPSAQLLASLPGVIAALLLFAPVLYLAYVFITLQTMLLAAVGLIVTLLFLLGLPLMTLATGIDRNLWPTRYLVPACAVICLATGILFSHHGPLHPQHDEIFYGLNANDHTAKWITFDKSPDAWTSQFFSANAGTRESVPDYIAGDTDAAIVSPAGVLPVPAPEASIQSDEKDGDMHSLRLSVRSPRRAEILEVVFPEKVGCMGTTIAGRDVPFDQAVPGLHLLLYGMANDPVDVKFKVKSADQISFWVTDQSFGLPFSPRPRPADIAPWPGSFDSTLLSRKYTLDGSLTAVNH